VSQGGKGTMAKQSPLGRREHRDSQGNVQVQTDYVPRGSDLHAKMLGLRKSLEGDPIVYEGYTFEDITQFGPAAQEWFIRQSLGQRVREFQGDVLAPQSEDRFASNYAPPMFDPEGGRVVIRG